ncbi:aminoglycoside adenylyltransferase domain-containing protein [Rossellomorea vietnamensis]|uniref:aminoglycoside adenylyltransferase domain-containing protein n=1 Tax=Rossellomorea vietnamensis TaxID=218284 RepID=UPI001653B089|nr:aminoglycoside adenylyltransferase domain-containing protein [Rossellomorea vietnamensis]
MFIVSEDLGKIRPDDNAAFPYYNDGKLKWDTKFNPVTWVLLKEKGISVLGPDITKFPFDASKDLLTSYVRENMNSYWTMRVERLENSLNRDMNHSSKEISEEVEWTVLGLLRQYFTLKESDITSKAEAGEYGLLNLPERWHPIIHEALNIRSNKYVKLFQFDKERVLETVKFTKYLIDHCNNIKCGRTNRVKY